MNEAVKRLKEAMSKEHKGWGIMRGNDRPCNGVIGVKNVAYKVKVK